MNEPAVHKGSSEPVRGERFRALCGRRRPLRWTLVDAEVTCKDCLRADSRVDAGKAGGA